MIGRKCGDIDVRSTRAFQCPLRPKKGGWFPQERPDSEVGGDPRSRTWTHCRKGKRKRWIPHLPSYGCCHAPLATALHGPVGLSLRGDSQAAWSSCFITSQWLTGHLTRSFVSGTPAVVWPGIHRRLSTRCVVSPDDWLKKGSTDRDGNP